MALARDCMASSPIRRRLPFLLEEQTSVLGASSVALTDGRGHVAVLACCHTAAATQGRALESRLEGARQVAAQRAAELVARGAPLLAAAAGREHTAEVAVGVISNRAGLHWVVPPTGMPELLPEHQRARPAGASRAGGAWWALRWAADFALAAAVALLVAAAFDR